LATGSQYLRSYAKKLKRLSDEAASAAVAAEDTFSTVEDRERHRVARSAAADADLRAKYTGLRGEA
jgi:hypothetical protein